MKTRSRETSDSAVGGFFGCTLFGVLAAAALGPIGLILTPVLLSLRENTVSKLKEDLKSEDSSNETVNEWIRNRQREERHIIVRNTKTHNAMFPVTVERITTYDVE